MQPRLDPVVVWLRALAVAALTLLLGIAGHVSADGLLPGPAVLVLLGAITLVTCAALLARPASTPRVVAMLVGGQTVIHLALTLTAGHTGDPTGVVARVTGVSGALPVVNGRRVGSLQDSYDVASTTDAVAPGLPIAHLASDLSAHAPMMAAHLAAAALVGLWLAIGERCLRTLLVLASASIVSPLLRACALLRPPAVRLPARPLISTESPRPAGTTRIARHVVRRGPPLLLAG
ncbi:MAG: hypothetical protein F2667_07160 [Actinobacteria bacterium]|nr:hypothetical protein [Actinomycetota bacterium]